ncbi:MAG: dTMP kinase [SAR86 cluster bacterium]|jgi:dTMP kinase|nr:dTMP kinase [SAR86 cluster bacterium]
MDAKFITLEGIEGSGKSTAITYIKQVLNNNNIPFIATREPGGGPNGSNIRDVLLHRDNKITPITELLLMLADRVDHVENVINPNLNKGIWVISDRYLDSTICYQGGGRGISQDIIMSITSRLDLPTPDLTLLFDLSVDEALKRVRSRGGLDRFEQESKDFHQRIRLDYQRIARENKDRIRIIDSSKEQADVQEVVSKLIFELV